jgi:hypothetical protein
MAKTLSIAFLNEQGKKVSISIDGVKDTATGADIKVCAEAILANNIFNSTGGDFVKIDSAQIVSRDVTPVVME